MERFIEKYKIKLKKQIDLINPSEIELLINNLIRCAQNNSSVYIIGNGGSAATASHMQNDLGSGLKRRGILDLDILSLCDNLSVITALANDISYQDIYYLQLKDTIKANDILIAISCSGTSPNIIKAVDYSKSIGATIVGFTGFDGGSLLELSDINFHVDTEKGEYGIVESAHVIINHILYSYFTQKVE